MDKLPKGTIVLVKAVAETGYSHNVFGTPNFPKNELVYSDREGDKSYKNLYRYPCTEPWKGIVVGYSTRVTGRFHPANEYSYDYDPAYLQPMTSHTVVMVEPLNGTRYFIPSACLPDDVEVCNVETT